MIVRTDAKELYHQNKQVLFDNEKFLISLIQVASLAIISGTLSQFSTLKELFGMLVIKILLTHPVISLTCSIMAAYLKCECKRYELEYYEKKQDVFLKESERIAIRMRCALTTSMLYLLAGLSIFALRVCFQSDLPTLLVELFSLFCVIFVIKDYLKKEPLI